jgi:hypothetical protein
MSEMNTPVKYQVRSIDALTRSRGVSLAGTAADRRVLVETNASAAPTLASDGFDITGAESLYIKLKATTNDCTVKLWEWDASSEEWAQNDTLGTVSLTAGATTQRLAPCLPSGGHRGWRWHLRGLVPSHPA